MGGIDGANDNSSLMADILPRDTSTFVGAFNVLVISIRCTWEGLPYSQNAVCHQGRTLIDRCRTFCLRDDF